MGEFYLSFHWLKFHGSLHTVLTAILIRSLTLKTWWGTKIDNAWFKSLHEKKASRFFLSSVYNLNLFRLRAWDYKYFSQISKTRWGTKINNVWFKSCMKRKFQDFFLSFIIWILFRDYVSLHWVFCIVTSPTSALSWKVDVKLKIAHVC